MLNRSNAVRIYVIPTPDKSWLWPGVELGQVEVVMRPCKMVLSKKQQV